MSQSSFKPVNFDRINNPRATDHPVRMRQAARNRLREGAGHSVVGLDFFLSTPQERKARQQVPGSSDLMSHADSPHLFDDDFRGRILQHNAAELYSDIIEQGRQIVEGERAPYKALEPQRHERGIEQIESEFSPIAAGNDIHKLKIVNDPIKSIAAGTVLQSRLERYRIILSSVDPFNPKNLAESEEWFKAADNSSGYEEFPDMTLAQIFMIAENSKDPRKQKLATQVVNREQEKRKAEILELKNKYPNYGKFLRILSGGVDSDNNIEHIDPFSSANRTSERHLGTDGLSISLMAELSQGSPHDFSDAFHEWKASTFPESPVSDFILFDYGRFMEAYSDRYFADVIGMGDTQDILGSDSAMSAFQKIKITPDMTPEEKEHALKRKQVYAGLALGSHVLAYALQNVVIALEHMVSPISHIPIPDAGTEGEQLDFKQNSLFLYDIFNLGIKTIQVRAAKRTTKLASDALTQPRVAGHPIKEVRRKDKALIISQAFMDAVPDLSRKEAHNYALAWARVSQDANPLKYLNQNHEDFRALEAARIIYQQMSTEARAAAPIKFIEAMDEVSRLLVRMKKHYGEKTEELIDKTERSLAVTKSKRRASLQEKKQLLKEKRTQQAQQLELEKNIAGTDMELSNTLDERARQAQTLFSVSKKLSLHDPHSFIDISAAHIANRMKEQIMKKTIKHSTYADVIEGNFAQQLSDVEIAALARLHNIPILTPDGQNIANIPNALEIFSSHLAQIVKNKSKIKKLDGTSHIKVTDLVNFSKSTAGKGVDMNKVNVFIAHRYDDFGAIRDGLDEVVMVKRLLRYVKQTDEKGRISPDKVAAKKELLATTETAVELRSSLSTLRNEAGKIDIGKLDETLDKLNKGLTSLRQGQRKEASGLIAAQKRIDETKKAEMDFTNTFLDNLTGHFPEEMTEIVRGRLQRVIADFQTGQTTPELMVDLLTLVTARDPLSGTLSIMARHQDEITGANVRHLLSAVVAGTLLFPRGDSARVFARLSLDRGASLEGAVDTLANTFLQAGELQQTLSYLARKESQTGSTARVVKWGAEMLRLGYYRAQDFTMRKLFLKRIEARPDLSNDQKLEFRRIWTNKSKVLTSLEGFHILWGMATTAAEQIEDNPSLETIITLFDEIGRDRFLSDRQNALMGLEVIKDNAED